MNLPFDTNFMINFFNIRNGDAIARQYITLLDLHRSFLCLFPNQIVLLFLLLSLLHWSRNFTMMLKFVNTENVMASFLGVV